MAKPKLFKTKKDKDLYWYKDGEGNKKFAYRHRYYDSLGNRREKSKQGFNTENEAMKELLKVKAQILNGQAHQVTNSNLTIGEWCDIFMDAKKQFWKPSTTNARNMYMNLYIKPLIGSYKISKLDLITYQRVFINVLSKKLSSSSVKTVHEFFSVIINAAVDNEIIPKNKFSKVSIKRNYADTKNDVLSVDQLKQFLDIMKNKNITQYTIAYLLAFTGMRVGEALGLTWNDINFENKSININKTRGELGVGPPKTLNSYREIAIDDTLTSILKRYEIYCKKIKLSRGITFKKDSFVFISKKNPNALGTSSVRYNFQTVSKKLRFRVHPHILRHTYASILIANGIDVVTVADRLGDSSEMVLKVYAHASKDKKNVTLEAFKDALQYDTF